ncbi:hypothetical protein IWX64_001406 [Arthrobacter sp. CAN_A212]|nr:hypothetical protein [Arthrobacter sp. CAN_C5]
MATVLHGLPLWAPVKTSLSLRTADILHAHIPLAISRL